MAAKGMAAILAALFAAAASASDLRCCPCKTRGLCVAEPGSTLCRRVRRAKLEFEAHKTSDDAECVRRGDDYLCDVIVTVEKGYLTDTCAGSNGKPTCCDLSSFRSRRNDPDKKYLVDSAPGRFQDSLVPLVYAGGKPVWRYPALMAALRNVGWEEELKKIVEAFFKGEEDEVLKEVGASEKFKKFCKSDAGARVLLAVICENHWKLDGIAKAVRYANDGVHEGASKFAKEDLQTLLGVLVNESRKIEATWKSEEEAKTDKERCAGTKCETNEYFDGTATSCCKEKHVANKPIQNNNDRTKYLNRAWEKHGKGAEALEHQKKTENQLAELTEANKQLTDDLMKAKAELIKAKERGTYQEEARKHQLAKKTEDLEQAGQGLQKSLAKVMEGTLKKTAIAIEGMVTKFTEGNDKTSRRARARLHKFFHRFFLTK